MDFSGYQVYFLRISSQDTKCTFSGYHVLSQVDFLRIPSGLSQDYFLMTLCIVSNHTHSMSAKWGGGGGGGGGGGAIEAMHPERYVSTV